MVATTVTAVTTATTATTAATLGMAAAFGVVSVILLIALLVSKELANATDNVLARRLSKAVNIATVPLLFTFCAITVSKVIAAIG